MGRGNQERGRRYSPELREPAVCGASDRAEDTCRSGPRFDWLRTRLGGASEALRRAIRVPHALNRGMELLDRVAGFSWCSRCRKDWQDGSHRVRPVGVGCDRRRRHDFGRQSSSALRRRLFARTCCPFCTRNSRRKTTLLTLAGAGAATPDSNSLLEHGEVIAHSAGRANHRRRPQTRHTFCDGRCHPLNSMWLRLGCGWLQADAAKNPGAGSPQLATAI